MKFFVKRNVAIAMIVLSIVAIAYVLYMNKTGSRINSLFVDADEYEQIIALREQRDDLFDDLNFDGQRLTFDSLGGYYMYSIVHNSNNAYDPVLSLDSDHSGIKVALLGDRISDETISQNKEIKVLVYDSYFYEESAFRCTTLPVVSITTDGDIPVDKEISVGMEMTLFDNSDQTGRRTITSDGSLHVRGNATLEDPKKSYKFELTKLTDKGIRSNDQPLLGMPEDDDWILTAMYGDTERIRDVFTTNLWKDSFATDNGRGLDLGTEYRYVEVFINERYEGLYALGYKIRNGQVGIKNGSDDKALLLMKDFRRGMPVYLDSLGAPYRFTVRSSDDTDAYGLLRDALISGFQRRDDASLLNMVDIDNVASYYLFINLIQGIDNVDGNQLVLVDNSSGDHKILYAPWDLDLTWGRGYGEGPFHQEYVLSSEDMLLCNYGIIESVIKQDPDYFKDQLRAKYSAMRSSKWSDEALLKLIDGYEKQLYGSGAMHRENDRWGTVHQSDYSLGLADFKNYVLARFAVMDGYMNDPEVEITDLDEELSFGVHSVYESVMEMTSSEDRIRFLQIADPGLWDESYYREFMETFNVPDEFVMDRITLKDHLDDYIGSEFFWETSEATDLIVLTENGECYTISNFFSGENSCELPQGRLTYIPDENGGGSMFLGDMEVVHDSAEDEGFQLRFISIDPEEMSVHGVMTW